MNTKSIFAALLSAAAFVSCSDDPTDPSIPQGPGIVFAASDGSEQTRTTIDGTSVLWQSGDAVGIFSPQIAAASNYKASIADEYVGMAHAALNTDLQYSGTAEHTFYAYYPYAASQRSASSVTGTISTSQDGIIAKNSFMWAATTVVPSQSPVELTFRHPFTYLNIQLRATDTYLGAQVRKIEIETAAGKTLAGDYTADLTTGTVTFTSSANAVSVTPSIANLAADYRNTFVVVNAEDLSDSELTVYVTVRKNQQDIRLKTTKPGRKLTPQSKLNLKLTVEELEEIKTGDPTDEPIEFADPIVEAICVDNWDTNGDGALSYKEAAAVTSLGSVFQGKAIRTFDELQYFIALESIGSYAFQSNSLMSIVIPDGVTRISDYAFKGCGGLESIVISGGVAYIGASAFEGCSSLASINIPDNVSSIGNQAFRNCSSLANINIPDGVTKINGSVFSGCSNLVDIIIPNGVTSIEDYAFNECNCLTNINIPDGVTKIGSSAFFGCGKLASIVIPDGVTQIGSSAFKNCCSLTGNITIPNKITYIGRSVFAGCSGLSSFYGKYASEDHRCLIQYGTLLAFAPAGLTEYTISDNVVEIGSSVFENYSSLTNIVIPDGVTVIGNYAFRNCSSLMSVYCKPAVPPTLDSYVFYYTPSSMKIYVLTASVEAYKTAANWKSYVSRIVGYDFE